MDSEDMSFWEGSYRSGTSGIPMRRLLRDSSRAFRSRRPLLLPLRIAPLQEILRARAAQMRAAVHHHHLAIDVTRPIRDQEACKISKLAVFARAAQRIF